ncbi:MAG: diacylglycerol kinase family lipid kinase [Ferrovibrio sp.]|uniref:diacylglycerol/lipid kinase family protein n=1 Tax=Ferrovibrio sp. TaxID=1917215 RepID=UPI00261680C9|nr:diacylglycerol kinase family protein [Ferrovibrio sp.]MCW0234663.1 diacylglycerol kinase family lipid kinase [Ferrovibrio sp.]
MPASQHATYRRRLLVIYNPTAGAGQLGRRKRARLEAYLDLLEDSGCAVEFRPTTKRGDAEAFAAEGVSERYDAVVAAGGDGTIGEVANGLPQLSAPLGIFPLGTANVLAMEIGLPLDPPSVMQAVLHGPQAQIWPGFVNDRLFTIMAGVGFDAHVVADLPPQLKRWLGKGAYVVESLRQLAAYKVPRYRVSIDGKEYDCASAVVAKGHFYGGKFVCAPHARLDDPAFEICLFRMGGRIGALRATVALTLGLLQKLPEIELVRGREVTISGADGEPVQADGDIAARLPASVRIGSRAIPLIVPKGSALAVTALRSAAE